MKQNNYSTKFRDTHIMIDEVQIVSWGYCHGVATSFCQFSIGLVQCEVYKDKGIVEYFTMSRVDCQVKVHSGKMAWSNIL